MGIRLKSMVVATTIFLMALACGIPSKYTVTVANKTADEITEVRVKWNDYVFSAGILPPSIDKSEAFPDAEFPQKAEVEWRTQDGIVHRVQVDVKQAIGRQSRWINTEILFSILDNETVHVSSRRGLA